MDSNDTTGCPTPWDHDNVFGPVVLPPCRPSFDFTLLFEQSIFALLPAALVLLVTPLRIHHLLGRTKPKGQGHHRHGATIRLANDRGFHLAKLLALSTLAALQLAVLVLWATGFPASPLRTVALAASATSLVANLGLLALSHAEHVHSVRPSAILNAYLLLSLALDAATTRSLWLARIEMPLRVVGLVALGCKAVVLVLEARGKGRYLRGPDRSDPTETPAGAAGPVGAGGGSAGTADRPVPGTNGVSYNPEELSGLYSRGIFWWLTPLLATGFRRLLKPLDLFVLDEEMRAEVLHDRFWMHWHRQQASNHRLIRVCIRTLARPLLAVIFPRLCLLAFTICQPLVLNRFLLFLQDPAESANIGYGLVGAYGLVYIGIAISSSFYWHAAVRALAMLRGILVTAVFSKTTQLSIVAGDDAAAVTLMSTDVDAIIRAVREVHEFWANILQIAIATWLLSTQLNFAASGPVIVSFVSLAATVMIGPAMMKHQFAWVGKVQKRVGVTSAMVGHIKSIKMSGLARKLSDTIAAMRVDEMKTAAPFRLISAITSALAQIPVMISPVVAFAMFTVVAQRTGETLDATRMFAALSLIFLLGQPLFWMFEVVLDMSAALACFKRIEKYLTENERVDSRLQARDDDEGSTNGKATDVIKLEEITTNKNRTTKSNGALDGVIALQGARFAWSTEGRPVMEGINLNVGSGLLAMLIGPVASGKSTLLKGVLGEVPHVEGSVRVKADKLAWCEQSPWITNATVKKNILGYHEFDAQLYDQVIKACQLEKDFVRLESGDQTMVGSKGLALSGGQKQRVALARALYSRPQVAVLDDIFSGLDNHTARAIFEQVFAPKTGLLRQWGTTILMATQSVPFMSAADHLVVLDKEGTVLEQGPFSHLSTSGGYIQTLLDSQDSTAGNVAAVSSSDEAAEDAPLPTRETKVKAQVEEEDARRQLGDHTIYRYYFSSVGISFIVIMLLLQVIWAFLETFPTVWLKFWTDANVEAPNQRNGFYLGIYAALQVLGVFFFGLLVWFVLVPIASRSGIMLHHRLLMTVIRAPLSLFSHSDLGAITTRFSQDIGMIDRALPLALTVSIASLFTCIGKAVLIASSTFHIAASFPFLLAIFYLLQRAYLRTSRQLRLLDLEGKEPVYAQFLETLGGLATLRAFGWGAPATRTNHDLVDRSQRPFYLLLMVQQWLTLVLDLITAALALLVVGLAVWLRDAGRVSVGLTGVALVQLISFTETIKMLIQFWTSLETSIGAVARIKQFGEKTGEENLPGEDKEVPPAWPAEGKIEVQNASASYGEDLEVKALDAVSLHVGPGEKIGICGRTGSGKSSLLLALLRLLDLSSGSMTIDGINLATIPREMIRSHLIAITQDQFVLPGTVRQNIDPFEAASDAEIMAALQRVGIREAIQERGGLDKTFEEDMLSHGQKQLFFLARAILRKGVGKVVLLDEATSSIDRHTEIMIQQVIRDEFKDHTVISIAHRLDTVLDFDRVIVLEKGCIVEEGVPRALLQTGQGRFKALWDASRREEPSEGPA